MAKLSAHGEVVIRRLSPRGYLKAYCSDGKVLARTVYSNGWKIAGKLKPNVAPLEAPANVRRACTENGEAWRLDVKRIPSQRILERWNEDGGCFTVTGEWVEPDGIGTDGAPSWLRALAMI
jgi:hypothetical protein